MILVIVTAVAFCLFCLVGATIVKASEPIVEINELGIEDLAVKGFELTEKSTIDIYAVGASTKYSKKFFAYGWILNAQNREVIWSMQEDCYDIKKLSETLGECDETIKLRPGKYEVYYYVGVPGKFYTTDISVAVEDLGDLVDLVGELFSGKGGEEEERFYEEDAEELLITIKTEQPARTYIPEFSEPTGSIVYFNQPEKDEYHHQGFTLKDKIDLEIYAIGEFSDSYDVFVDGAWIVNADTRKKVWSMDKWNTERAGGVAKNRLSKDLIALPAGDYIAYYATDDSHDPGEWNSPPPNDPKSYGLSISVADPGDAKFVAPFDEELNETEIVSLTRIRADEFENAGFILNHDAKIHIVGLGERDYSKDNLVDYGWIVDADDLDRIWEMTAENTGHAGGAAKNCRFDGVIDLPAGNYIVYYRTDDSHSYGDWNSPPPFDKGSWGVALYGIGDNFGASSFSLVDKFQPLGNALVDLSGLGDDADVDQSFSLDGTTRVRILALGEGKGSQMYDYGWVENDNTGEIVWEMTYRKTDHAGGATKNRMVVANLTLDKGGYTAYFVTDDSHSYEDFNASPPDNPERWGMIVTKK